MLRLFWRTKSNAVNLAHSSGVVSGRTLDLINRLSNSDLESFPPAPKDFEDRRRITFRSGKGGDPAPNAVRGQRTNGPGFGGHGGSVFLEASAEMESLAELPNTDDIAADSGRDGHGTSRGVHGRDKIVRVPLGTIVRERIKTDRKSEAGRAIYSSKFVYQFLTDGDRVRLCEGGKGGLGPFSFKKHDGRKGAHGERKSIELELRLVNDCALIGAPNSGKSSIISALTSTNIRIGPEPYSTKRPHLGTLQFKDGVEVKVLDLPGLVKGDATDKDRGLRVLRHIWRSKVLLYCVDVSSDIDPLEQYMVLRSEVKQFDSKYPRAEIIIGTKCDMLQKDSLLKLDSLYFRVTANNQGDEIPVVGTSARFGLGINHLVSTIRRILFPSGIQAGAGAPRFEKNKFDRPFISV